MESSTYIFLVKKQFYHIKADSKIKPEWNNQKKTYLMDELKEKLGGL